MRGQEAIKKEDVIKILELIETSPKLKQKLRSAVFQGKDDLVTITYLDRQLAKLSKEFDEKLLKQSERLSKEFDEKLLKQSERLSKEFDEKLLKQSERLSKEFDEKLLKQREEISKDFDLKLLKHNKDLKDHINAKFGVIGSRWGKRMEQSFRDSLKEILQKEFNAKIVERWYYKGKIPQIDATKEEYEIDVYIEVNGRVILVEYKSSADLDDLVVFNNNCLGYEYIAKRKANRKVFVTPYAEEGVKEKAQALFIEIVSPAELDKTNPFYEI